jgi:methionyl-tRNA formyltransferase
MLIEEGHDVAAVWSPYDVESVFDEPKDALTKRVKGTPINWMPPIHRTPYQVEKLEVDLFVAAHSHDFIGRASRAATRLGGIGYHPSLLPRHRGRDAVRWTVHFGDPISGGSVYWLTDNVDGGPIAAQDWCFVEPSLRTEAHPIDGPGALWRQKLFPMGVRLLRGVLRDLDRGVMVEIPQEELNATWEPSWERPPLHRPELPQIGSNGGMEHVTRRNADLDIERRAPNQFFDKKVEDARDNMRDSAQHDTRGRLRDWAD